MPAPRLILASASPRRSDILRKCGLRFDVHVTNVDEIDDEQADPIELAQQNAVLKARAVASLYPQDVILAADTVVLSDDKVLSKPNDVDHALEMFASYLKGHVSVFTGLAVHYQGRLLQGVDETRLSMYGYSDQEYRTMARELLSLDKAGGFTIEGMGAILFDNIQGSFYNVLGLPVHKVYQMLASLDLDLWSFREDRHV